MGPDQGGLTKASLEGLRIAYVVSRFPKITETFVVREAVALEALGAEVHFFPLVGHDERVQQPETARFEGRVHRPGGLSPALWLGALVEMSRRPRRTARALRSLASATGGSRAHLLRALAIAPRAFWLARRLRALDCAHVHAHFATHPALAALLAHELSDVPYSFTAHGSDLHKDPRGLRAKVLSSAFTVTVSNYNRRFIAEYAGEDVAAKVEVVRCGADFGAFRARAGEPPPIPFRIACVAALREVKGHEFLLRAVRELIDGGLDVRCELAGDGPLRESLQALAYDLGVNDQISFLGAQPGPEVRALLERSHVCVLASIQDRKGRREGIPVSLMEAMAVGLPVAASRISGIPELVPHGEAGLLFEPGDASGLAAALETLAGDAELRQRLGARGLGIVSEEYDLDRNAAQLASLVRAAAGAPGAPSHRAPQE